MKTASPRHGDPRRRPVQVAVAVGDRAASPAVIAARDEGTHDESHRASSWCSWTADEDPRAAGAAQPDGPPRLHRANVVPVIHRGAARSRRHIPPTSDSATTLRCQPGSTRRSIPPCVFRHKQRGDRADGHSVRHGVVLGQGAADRRPATPASGRGGARPRGTSGSRRPSAASPCGRGGRGARGARRRSSRAKATNTALTVTPPAATASRAAGQGHRHTSLRRLLQGPDRASRPARGMTEPPVVAGSADMRVAV